MLLRTRTTREAADWLRVLENEIVVGVPDQLKFLNVKLFDMMFDVMLWSLVLWQLRAVLIDIGTSSLRAGIAYDDGWLCCCQVLLTCDEVNVLQPILSFTFLMSLLLTDEKGEWTENGIMLGSVEIPVGVVSMCGNVHLMIGKEQLLLWTVCT